MSHDRSPRPLGFPVGAVLVAALWVPLALPCSVPAEDWPYWRGPRYDGTSRETGLIDTWDPAGGPGSHVLWQRDDLGGRSTPVVFEDRLYTIVRAEPGTAREGERVVCVDARTGKTLWENRFNVWLSDVPDTRVGWSSCVVDPSTGRVYALGVCGFFQCLDGKTGETVWSVPLHEEFGLLSTYGGRTNFPVIFEDLVIISGVIIGWGDMAKPAHRFIAFDKESGEVVWFNGTRLLPEDTTYSAPVITTLAGQAALVAGSGDGQIWAIQPRTGEPIWNFALSRRGLNTAPLVVGERIYGTHSEENLFGTAMGAVVAIDGTLEGDITESGERWRVEELMVGKSSPVAVDGRLFLFDDRAKLHVLDMDTGETAGRRVALGTTMRASPLYADGKIYALTASEQWAILRPDARRGAVIVAKGRLLSGDEAHASPICSNGRLFMQTTGRLYCVGAAPAGSPPGNPPAALVATSTGELSRSEDRQPAHLQLVPAEILMGPGDSRQLKARFFNSRGQLLGDAEPVYQLEGPGAITAGGKFTAADAAGLHAVTIRATAAGLEAVARARVFPPLPWKFTFDEIALNLPGRLGEPPLPWVGCRYRHVIRDLGGNQVMVKVSTIPKGTRSRGFIGPSHLSNYTIQADVRGASENGQMPDIGIVAQGYTLVMLGVNQELQIRSWDAQLRMAETIPFQWQPDTWYTMKLRAEVDGGKAHLQGKVWPRDTQEPTEWTLQAEDEVPNRSGSPGLFGNATPAEIYLDNLQVTSN